MATSTTTKKYRKWFWVFAIASVLLNVVPVAVYVLLAFFESALVIEKVGLCSTVLVVLIMTVVAQVNKVAMRSRLWILLIGLYLCLDYFITPLIIIAVCQVADEVIATPAKNYTKTRLVINKEMDKRL